MYSDNFILPVRMYLITALEYKVLFNFRCTKQSHVAIGWSYAYSFLIHFTKREGLGLQSSLTTPLIYWSACTKKLKRTGYRYIFCLFFASLRSRFWKFKLFFSFFILVQCLVFNTTKILDAGEEATDTKILGITVEFLTPNVLRSPLWFRYQLRNICVTDGHQYVLFVIVTTPSPLFHDLSTDILS